MSLTTKHYQQCIIYIVLAKLIHCQVLLCCGTTCLPIQTELSLLLYPVFVHLYLDLIRGGHSLEGMHEYSDQYAEVLIPIYRDTHTNIQSYSHQYTEVHMPMYRVTHTEIQKNSEVLISLHIPIYRDAQYTCTYQVTHTNTQRSIQSQYTEIYTHTNIQRYTCLYTELQRDWKVSLTVWKRISSVFTYCTF